MNDVRPIVESRFFDAIDQSPTINSCEISSRAVTAKPERLFPSSKEIVMLAPRFSAIAPCISRLRSVFRHRFLFLALPLVLVAAMNRTAAATNGTWINATSGGLWSATANWSGGTIANGTDGIADFSTLNITADNTVQLDSARTIGQLKFGNTTPSNNWILDNNLNAANTLTMAVSSGSPQITVNNDQATINLSLLGSNVFGNFVVVNGPGTLVLGGTTDNGGLGISVNSGTVILAKTSSGSPNDVHAIGGPGLTINGGLAQLGGSGGDQIYDFANVTVNSGAFDAAGQSETFNVLSLAGTGVAGSGALLNSGDSPSTITPAGGIVLTANTTIGVTQNNGNLTLNSTIRGAFGITKVGPGTLTLEGSGSNTFTGTTAVNAGTLVLDRLFPSHVISSTLNIGTGTGLPGSAVVLDENDYQLGDPGLIPTSNVTIESDGILNLQGFSDNIGNLTMTGGTVTSSSGGVLGIGGTSITTKASSYTATISVRQLYLPSVLFTVAQGTTANGIDLDVSAPLADYNHSFGLFGSITKTGPGAMHLSGNNTLSGGVALNAGTIIIGNNNALGLGTLTAGGGALAADNNGPYVVSNAISLPTTLAVSGGGNFTLAGSISGTGGLTITGTGALTLSGVESFTGSININGGSLVMSTSLSNNITNAGTFVYNSGTFGGRLTNLGTVILNAAFTAANGMENDSTFTLATGQTVTLNGAGLDNEGTFTMTGGTFNLNPAGNNVNNGNFNLSAYLGLGAATLSNGGSLNLNGGLVSGATGSLVNTADGMIVGTGAIQCSFTNSGGVLAVGNGTMNISQTFANSGLIQLTAFNSKLTGGAISNNGGIRGSGALANAVMNTGSIEPLGGGILAITGSLTNLTGGLINTSTGNELFVTQGASYQLGLATVQLHDFAAAERALQQAVALDPKFAQTHFQLGNVYFITHRFNLAEQSYRRAVALSPHFADGHGNLGAVLLQLGRVTEAKDALLAALEFGDNPQCHYNLGLILLIERNAPQARVHLRHAESFGQDITPEIRQAAGL
jgi:autotransporter-associated beta strand protein